MSSRLTVNQFGSSVFKPNNNNEINLNHTDKLYLNTTGDTLTGDLQMNNNKLYFDNNKTHSISYQELGLLKYLQLNTVNGLAVVDSSNINLCQILNDSIDINKSKIKNVGDPSEETDAANKKYVDNNKSSFTGITSDLDMKNKKIINLGAPTDDNDSVTKVYCDTKVHPNTYVTFIRSGSDIRFSIDNNNNWSICMLTVRFYNKRTSVSIPRYNPDVNYDVVVRGDGKPGDTSYKYTYFGNVKITNATDTHVSIHAENFGYNEDETTVYSTRNNSTSYGIESVIIH